MQLFETAEFSSSRKRRKMKLVAFARVWISLQKQTTAPTSGLVSELYCFQCFFCCYSTLFHHDERVSGSVFSLRYPD